MNCCGATGPLDYQFSVWFNHSKNLEGVFVPPSCCVLLNDDPRHIVIKDVHRCQLDAILYPITTYSLKSQVLHAVRHVSPSSPVHTGDKVEFNTVDFAETKSTVSATKLKVSATESTATSCRIHVVADLLPKPATKLNIYGISRLCCRFVTGFGSSRLSTKSTVLNSTLSQVCTGL